MRCVVVAGLVTPGLHVVCQTPAPLRQPDSVPFELAAQLMGAGGLSSDAQILVGSVPEWISNRIVAPSATRIVGSAFIGNTVVAVYAFPPDADSALADFRKELMKKGWLNPPPNPMNGMNTGGFRPASMSGAGNAYSIRNTLCREPEMLNMSMSRNRGLAVYVTLRLSSTVQYSACRPQQMPNMAAMNSRPPFPTLYNPSGVQETSFVSAECTDTRYAGNTQANFMTQMSTDAILDHYAKQLADSGWKPVSVQPTVTARAYTRPDSTGKPIETVLTASTMPGQPTCKSVVMTATPGKR